MHCNVFLLKCICKCVLNVHINSCHIANYIQQKCDDLLGNILIMIIEDFPNFLRHLNITFIHKKNSYAWYKALRECFNAFTLMFLRTNIETESCCSKCNCSDKTTKTHRIYISCDFLFVQLCMFIFNKNYFFFYFFHLFSVVKVVYRQSANIFQSDQMFSQFSRIFKNKNLIKK